MKRITLLLFALLSICTKSFAQSEHVIGPVERKITDSICASVNKLDLSKINTQEQAVAAYTQCVGDHIDLLNDLATERNVDMADEVAMKKVGIDLAFNLYKMKCEKFMKLSTLMAMKSMDKGVSLEQVTTGAFKRIDNKGFNYIVIKDAEGNEKSFLWLRQFPGSEKFTNGVSQYAGKKIKIGWQEIEVYLPQAKGYYKVKEITSLDVQ